MTLTLTRKQAQLLTVALDIRIEQLKGRTHDRGAQALAAENATLKADIEAQLREGALFTQRETVESNADGLLLWT